jgi:undecaprenyl-diphosphatase
MTLARLLLRSGRAMLEAQVWSYIIAFVAAVTLAWVYQDPLQAQLQGRGGSVARAVATFANLGGSGFAVTAMGVAALIVGRVRRKEELVQAAVVLAVAGFWAFLLVRVGQFALAERRPLDGGAMQFFAPGGHGVSGHAAAAALLVLPVHDVWLRGASPRSRRLAAVLLTAWAAIVGWSRVWMGMHFAWNVLAGFAIGFWASAGAVAAWRESKAGTRDDE